MAEKVVAANEVGKSCPYCRFPLKAGTSAYICDSCGAMHHSDCWQEGNGCSVFGCAGSGTAQPAPPVFNTAPAPTSDATTQRIPVAPATSRHSQIPQASAGNLPPSDDPNRSSGNHALLIALVCLLASCLVGGGVYLVASSSSGGGAKHVIVADQTKTVVHTVTSNRTVDTPTSRTSTQPSTTAANSGPPLTTYQAPTYSVGYPTGWTPVQQNAQVHGGNQSKFVDPSNNEIYVLIGDTPGYAGPIGRAAAGVRSTVNSSSSYQQLRWGPADGGHQWDWLFTDQGIEQTDTFERACDTGYGVLGSAPADTYQRYASLFHSVLTSFHPSCN
jgi:Prokaryotic RING finger family 1